MERGRYGEGHLSRPLIYLSLQRLGMEGWGGGCWGVVGFVGITLTVGRRFIFFKLNLFLCCVFFSAELSL